MAERMVPGCPDLVPELLRLRDHLRMNRRFRDEPQPVLIGLEAGLGRNVSLHRSLNPRDASDGLGSKQPLLCAISRGGTGAMFCSAAVIFRPGRCGWYGRADRRKWWSLHRRWFRWGLIHGGEAAVEIGQKRRGQLPESIQEILDVRFDVRNGRGSGRLVGLGCDCRARGRRSDHLCRETKWAGSPILVSAEARVPGREQTRPARRVPEGCMPASHRYRSPGR
jgi:hypothetical protein